MQNSVPQPDSVVSGLSRKKLIFILGLISMLMPLSIDMYLPSFPAIGQEFGVNSGLVQMTLSIYVAGFALGQLFFGPMADSLGRKPIIVGGILMFAIAAVGCALAKNIDQLIAMRLLHGLSAAAASVVINALMRDLFEKDEFSRMMSFVTLVMTIAPLLAPIIGGWLQLWFSWHASFLVLAITAILTMILVITSIPETLKKENRQRFHFMTTIRNFVSLFRHRRVIGYMMASAFSFAGMFSFLSLGPFVYIELNQVPVENFGYYFALNIGCLIVMTSINSRNVRRRGAAKMMRFGLTIQLLASLVLLAISLLDLGFIPLVIFVALYMGCISMISSNAMAIILENFPHMAGTAASLAGTLRFGIGAIVGFILAKVSSYNELPMVSSMMICVAVSILLFIYASRKRKA